MNLKILIKNLRVLIKNNDIKLHFLILILYTILSIVLTYPLILRINNALDLGDPAFIAWVMAWDVHILTTDPLNFFNSNIFYPFFENSLALSEHLFADMIIAFPVIVISHNPILAYNITFILSFVLSGYGIFLLINYYKIDKYSAFIGGVAFAFCAFRFAHMWHLQLLTVQWLPFCLLYLDKFLHKWDSKNLLLLYIFFILQVLSSWYLAFYSTISLAVYALGLLTIEKDIYKNLFRLKHVSMLILFITCVGIVVSPFAIPYIQVSQYYGFERSLEEVSSYSADLADYFLTLPNNLIYGRFSEPIQINRNAAEHSLFPGLCVIVLTFYGLFSFTRLRLYNKEQFGLIYIAENKQNIFIGLFFISFILSLGYPLHFFGHIIDIYMPYKFLYEYLPGFKSMRCPSRFGIIVMLSLSILAAYGLHRLIYSKTKGKKFAISFLIMIIILIENLYIPLDTIPCNGMGNLQTMPIHQEIPEVYSWLANETDSFSIVEIPTGSLRDSGTPIWYDTKYMYFSTFHWKYLVNGYSGFLPTPYLDILGYLQSFPSNDSIDLLQKIGVKYVIVHMDKIDPQETNRVKDDISIHYSDGLKLVNILNNSYIYRLNRDNDSSNYLIFPLRGFHALESWSDVQTRWMQADMAIAILSPQNRTARLSLRALSFYRPRTLEVYVGDELATRVVVPPSFVNVTVPIHLFEGMNVVRLQVPEGCERPCDIKALNNPDSRCLSIAVQNMTAT